MKEIKNYVVFNAEILIEKNNKRNVYSNTLIGDGYNLLLSVLNTIELEDICIDESPNTENYHKSSKYKNEDKELNNVGVYVRPTVYEKDNRIDFRNNLLLPGSCITTMGSYTNCASLREDPFDKYVLFYVKNMDKAVDTGKFRNAFGLNGGGKRICFNSSSKVLVKRTKENEMTNHELNNIISNNLL